MLTGLEVSCSLYKYTFYKPQHDSKGAPNEIEFEGLKMQK